MILAAGRGQRLRPFTDRSPKPLVEIAGQPLIAHHLRKLAAAGVREVVINTAYRGDQLRRVVGDGSRYGLSIRYTVEVPGALDTGGGIANALSLLGPDPFAVISADMYSDIDYTRLAAPDAGDTMRLFLVDNPAHHAAGDFGLCHGRVVTDVGPRLTYAGLGVYDPALFRAPAGACFALSRVMQASIAAGRAAGCHHRGRWIDVGRAGTLAAARQVADRR